MTIGSGIAILGIWLVPIAAILSRRVDSDGVVMALVAAFAATGLVVGIR